MMPAIPSSWPKLSDLPGRAPNRCQRCDAALPLTRWQEHDDADRPTLLFVVLCKPCADEIIEPHPRLYKEMGHTPTPGAMGVCADCQWRHELTCKCPLAMFNGGPKPGLEYEPKGSMVHVCRTPRRLSGWQYMAPGPVAKCSGKDHGQKTSP